MTSEYRHHERGRGVTNIAKTFSGQATFSGLYHEDLKAVHYIFDSIALMCDSTPDEKRKAMPIMLKGPALTLFTQKAGACETYDQAADLLREWYNSPDKQSRLLAEWQTQKLTDSMATAPNDAEVTVFRRFVSSMMSLQEQLHRDYRTDRQLRDRLLNAVDIPHIQDSLRDRATRTAQQLINRVATRLSTRPRQQGPSQHAQQNSTQSEMTKKKYTG